MHPAENSEPASGVGQDERRGAPRRRVLKAAKVVYNGGHSVLDASLQDISETGARIRLQAPAILPDDFDLHLSDGRKLRVETVWTAGAMLGVRFVAHTAQTPRAAQTAPCAAGGRTGALLERIAQIEASLAEFRRDLIAHLRD